MEKKNSRAEGQQLLQKAERVLNLKEMMEKKLLGEQKVPVKKEKVPKKGQV